MSTAHAKVKFKTKLVMETGIAQRAQTSLALKQVYTDRGKNVTEYKFTDWSASILMFSECRSEINSEHNKVKGYETKQVNK